MTIYRTVKTSGYAEFEISKSRFLVSVERTETEAAALQFIEGIRRKYSDATHNCTAYIVGLLGQQQRADDDGEPVGTAAKPILEVIKKSGLTDVAIVVTRYYGGIKLGAGGLIRAYGKSASLGIRAAGMVERILHTCLTVGIDYTFLGKVEKELRAFHYEIENISYLANVTLLVLVEKGQEAVLAERLAEWTAGQAAVQPAGEKYVETAVEFGPASED